MKPRIRSYGAGQVTIEADEKDIKKIQGMINGVGFIGVNMGQLELHSRFLPLPDPIHDEAMTPFWSRPSEEEQASLEKFTFEELDLRCSYGRSITIQSLCGYNYSQSNYEMESARLKNYGFIQMRSTRGIDGGYWEIWYLPGIWSASGDLRLHLQNKKEEWGKRKLSMTQDDEFGVALEYIRTTVQFGTLDVSVQRMAMVLD